MAKKGLVKKACIIFCLLFLTSAKSWTARIPGGPQVFIDETFTVNAGYYMAYKLPNSQVGTKWSFKITVLSGGSKDVNIWFMDSENYMRFQHNQTYSYYSNASKERATEFIFEFIPKSNKAYHLVLDNSFSLFTSKEVKVYAIEVNVLYEILK